MVKSSLISLNPTNEEVEELKNEIDEDGDGEIDFDEFLKIMNSTKLRFKRDLFIFQQMWKNDLKTNAGCWQQRVSFKKSFR